MHSTRERLSSSQGRGDGSPMKAARSSAANLPSRLRLSGADRLANSAQGYSKELSQSAVSPKTSRGSRSCPLEPMRTAHQRPCLPSLSSPEKVKSAGEMLFHQASAQDVSPAMQSLKRLKELSESSPFFVQRQGPQAVESVPAEVQEWMARTLSERIPERSSLVPLGGRRGSTRPGGVAVVSIAPEVIVCEETDGASGKPRRLPPMSRSATDPPPRPSLRKAKTCSYIGPQSLQDVADVEEKAEKVKRIPSTSTASVVGCQISEPSGFHSARAGKTNLPLRSLELGTGPFGLAPIRRYLGHVPVGKEESFRLKCLFKRFEMNASSIIFKDDLFQITQMHGAKLLTRETLDELVSNVTTYDEVDFEDFCLVFDALKDWERQEHKTIYHSMLKGEKRLPQHLLPQFFAKAGIQVQRKKVNEILKNANGDLSFEMIEQIVYFNRMSEGLTMEDFEKFQRSWGPLADSNDVIQVDQLHYLLSKVFVGRNSHLVDQLQDQVKTMGVSSQGRAQGPMSRQEVLIWIRLYREADIEEMMRVFAAVDADHSGYIDDLELITLRRWGYSIQEDAIMELRDDVIQCFRTSGSAECDAPGLTFLEFVQLIHDLYDREGFTKDECQNFLDQFEFFDWDNSGELDHVEISNILRYMGYKVRLEEVQVRLAAVDSNMNGTLDYSEFLRIIRIYREDFVEEVRKVYEQLEIPKLGFHSANFGAACTILGLKEGDPQRALQKVLEQREANRKKEKGRIKSKDFCRSEEREEDTGEETFWSFYEFLREVDGVRDSQAEQRWMTAGLESEELQRIRAYFNAYDKDRKGWITVRETGQLLEQLQIHLRTREEQAQFLVHLRKARDTANYRDTSHSTGTQALEQLIQGAEDPEAVTFIVLLQLIRAIQNETCSLGLARFAEVAQETKFTVEEIDALRLSFLARLNFEEEYRATQAESLPFGAPQKMASPTVLDKDGLRRFLQSLGAAITAEMKARLDAKVNEISEHGALDFVDFLRLARWMIDTNFCEVQPRG